MVHRGQKRGLSPGQVRDFVARIVGCWSANFGGLYALAEAASGLNRGEVSQQLGVDTRTLQRWQSGKTAPKRPDFEALLPSLVSFSGVERGVWQTAWERSAARRRSPGYHSLPPPRPAWAEQFAGANLPLRFYLIRLREDAELTKAQAANLLGVSSQRYDTWEEGVGSPRKWQIGRLWRLLGEPRGITLSELETARDQAAAAASSIMRNRNRLAAQVLKQQEVDLDDAFAALKKMWGVEEEGDH